MENQKLNNELLKKKEWIHFHFVMKLAKHLEICLKH